VIYLSIGRRELGKTTLAYYMARKVDRCSVLDPRQMIQHDRADVETVTRSSELDDHALYLLRGTDTRELIYHPYDDDLDEAFDRWTSAMKRAIVACPSQSVALMVDEASFFNLQSPRFQWLAKCTYRDQVHILITAHRPIDVPTSIRSIADHWCIFSTSLEHDVAVFDRHMGPAVVSSVRRLQGREYVHWDDAHKRMRVQRDARVWHVALSDGPRPLGARVIDDVEAEDVFDLEQ